MYIVRFALAFGVSNKVESHPRQTGAHSKGDLISQAVVSRKNTDSLRIVWKPSVYGKFYPQTQGADHPAPIPTSEV